MAEQVRISKSEVSRETIEAGTRVLQELAERADGIQFADYHVLAAVDADGRKHVLGLCARRRMDHRLLGPVISGCKARQVFGSSLLGSPTLRVWTAGTSDRVARRRLAEHSLVAGAGFGGGQPAGMGSELFTANRPAAVAAALPDDEAGVPAGSAAVLAERGDGDVRRCRAPLVEENDAASD